MKLLIVEDERIEREALVRLISENFKNDIDLITTTDNGAQALTAIEKENYQLIITDINMPKLGGLQLLAEIRKHNPDVRVILLTGYDYFEYAQSAIRLGVDDFILKPATQHEIIERIQKVISLIDHDKSEYRFSKTSRFKDIESILQSDMVYAILYNDLPQHIKHYFLIFHMKAEYAFCLCFRRNQTSQKEMTDIKKEVKNYYENCFYESYFDNFVMFVFHNEIMNNDDILRVKSISLSIIGTNRELGIGGIKHDVSLFRESFIEAITNLTHTKKDKGTTAFQINEEIDHPIKQIAYDVCQNIKFNRLSDAERFAEQIRSICISMSRNDIKYNIKMFNDVLFSDCDSDLSLNQLSNQLSEEIQKAEYIVHPQDVYNYIIEIINNVINPFVLKRRKKMNILIQKSYEFVEKNFSHPIGLNDLADYLGVTPQYISSLLSTHTSQGFTNILAKQRIEKAKELLQKNMKIKEIAYLVGFQNQNYFAKTFKKITGYTPKEYKNIHAQK